MQLKKRIHKVAPIPPKTASTAKMRDTSNVVSEKCPRCNSEYPAHCPSVQSSGVFGTSHENKPAPTRCDVASPSGVGSLYMSPKSPLSVVKSINMNLQDATPHIVAAKAAQTENIRPVRAQPPCGYELREEDSLSARGKCKRNGKNTRRNSSTRRGKATMV